MTPYREMHKRKLLAAKEKEEDQKKEAAAICGHTKEYHPS